MGILFSGSVKVTWTQPWVLEHTWAMSPLIQHVLKLQKLEVQSVVAVVVLAQPTVSAAEAMIVSLFG